MAKLIFGCGYLGGRVARFWRQAGDDVFVVTRSRKRASELAAEGLRSIVADVTVPETLRQLPASETVLFSVSQGRNSDQSIRDVYVQGLANVLEALPENTKRFIYTSSTGVYGQNDGSWVDELSPCEPIREGGRACLAAERLLADHPLGQRAIVLRLSGLYGPGRVPYLEKLRRAEPISAPLDGYLNLIHVEDAAQTVLISESRATLPSTFTVSDGHPVTPRDYYREVVRLIAAPEPKFIDPATDSPQAQRAKSNKRVRNGRLLKELAVTLTYPTYREGLANILDG